MGKKILAIDDEISVRLAFELALSESGYEVATAASGEDGLMQAKESPPDLIFLDLRMPGIDGVETLRRLHREHPHMPPVYVVTAFRKEFLERLKRAADEGLTFQVVDKPVTIDQIQSIARSVFEGPERV